MTSTRHGARPRLARRLSWLAVLSLTSAALLVPATSVSATAPGNNGTVKIEDSVDPKEEPANDPHVCQFDIKFFFADPAQSGDWFIESWPPTGDKTTVLTGTYDTDGAGFDREPDQDYFSLPDGHYKLNWRGDEENLWKHKVFWVECQPEEEEEEPVVTPTPTPAPTDDEDEEEPVVTPTPTPAPTDDEDEEEPVVTPTPTPAPTDDEDERQASILIAKIDNKGTADPDDDEALDGATFEVRADDGDEVFEADQDELIFGPAAAPDGMLDTDLLDGGMYWIVETIVPAGFIGTDPILVELNVDPSVTCAWDFGGLIACEPNQGDASELSWTIVIVDNTPEGDTPETPPTGGVGGAVGTPRATLPATDTFDGASSTAPAGESWRLVLLAMAAFLTAALMLTPARAAVRRDDRIR
jgi:prealbumin domain-containing protein